MADKKDKSSDKKPTGETARRIWLAGIGAYGRAFTEAQEAFKDVTGNTSKVFDELVQKGEMIESLVGAKSKSMMKKAKMPDLDLDDRISKMRSRLSRGEEMAQDIDALEARMNAMDAKLDKILSLLEPKKPVRKAPKKSVKKPAKKTTKTQRTAKK